MTGQSQGTVIDGKYRVLSLLGSGGLGTVYKAHQIDLNREVAIKILHGSAASNPDSLARFEREARVLGTLHHRNIVSVYNFGLLENGSPYMAMELLEGKTLYDLLQEEKRLPWKRATKLVIQCCLGLSVAHKAGVIHRDLKPQNIVLLDKPEPDLVKVLDFGLSRLLPEAAHEVQKLTQTGALIGSVSYMSPELCSGLKADAPSDIYSMGCILYEILTGVPPIESDNPIGMLNKHINEMPQSFSQVLPKIQIPKELEYVVFRALQKAPEDRFASMQEMADTLQLIFDGKAGQVTVTGINLGLTSPKAKTRTKLELRVLLAVCAVMAIAVGTYYYFRPQPNRQLPRQANQALASRYGDIARANQFLADAEKAYKSGNVKRCEKLLERTMDTIGHIYQAPAMDVKCTEDDIEILATVADLSQKIPLTVHGGLHNSLDRIERNGNVGLDVRKRYEFTLALARLHALHKSDEQAIIKFTALVSEALNKKNLEQVMELTRFAHETIMKDGRAPDDPAALLVDILNAKVAVAHNEKERASALLQKVYLAVQKNDDGENLNTFAVLKELFAMEQILGKKDMSEETFKHLLGYLESIRLGHFQRIDESIKDLSSVNYETCERADNEAKGILLQTVDPQLKKVLHDKALYYESEMQRMIKEGKTGDHTSRRIIMGK